MVVYVLSRFDGTGLGDVVDGVYGVFTTLDKAKQEACKHMLISGEKLLDYDYNDFNGIWNYFSNKATYHIESMRLDDSCFD